MLPSVILLAAIATTPVAVLLETDGVPAEERTQFATSVLRAVELETGRRAELEVFAGTPAAIRANRRTGSILTVSVLVGAELARVTVERHEADLPTARAQLDVPRSVLPSEHVVRGAIRSLFPDVLPKPAPDPKLLVTAQEVGWGTAVAWGSVITSAVVVSVAIVFRVLAEGKRNDAVEADSREIANESHRLGLLSSFGLVIGVGLAVGGGVYLASGS